MTTTEALKSGAGTLAETAAGAVSELAEKAAEKVKAQAETVVSEARDRLSEREPRHRGRTLLIGGVLVGAAAAAFRYLRRSGLLGRQQERVIDLTQDPVVAPETLPTG